MTKFEAKDEEIAADDYRAYFDSSCFRVWHLAGKARVFRITKVTRFTSEMRSGGKTEIKKQPKLELVTLKGDPVPLPLLLNKTNANTIAQLYGTKIGGWIGKLIELYPATTSVGGAEKECIRIKNQAPKPKGKQSQDESPLIHERDQREPGEDEPPADVELPTAGAEPLST